MMSRMEPVAWRKENPRYTGERYLTIRYFWTEKSEAINSEDGWVPVYTADQIHELVEEVRAELDDGMPPAKEAAIPDNANGFHNAVRYFAEMMLAQLEGR